MNVLSSPSGPHKFKFKPTRQPMLWAALAYSLGIVAGVDLWSPVSLWVAAALAFVAAAAYFMRSRVWLGYGISLGVFFLAGALHVQLWSASPLLDTAIRPFTDGREVQITAHVIRNAHLRQASFGEVQQTVDVETEEVKTDARQSASVNSGIRLNIYAPRTKDAGADESGETGADSAIATSMRVFRYGERIRFFAKLRLPRNFRNPGAFDYEGYLAANGIAALGSAKIENVEVISGFAGSRVEYWRTLIHRSVVAKVHRLWAPREATLIDAMVIGDEAFIDRDTRVDFQRSGT